MRSLKKIGVALAAALSLSGLAVISAPAAQATYIPPKEGTHTATVSCASLGSSLEMTFTVAGGYFQMESVTYHGPGQVYSPVTKVDNWISPTGGGAGGNAAQVFNNNVVDGQTATKTSHRSGVTWDPTQLSTTLGAGHNFLRVNFQYYSCGTAGYVDLDLSTWASYPNELNPSGSYTSDLHCTTTGSPTYSDNERVAYTIAKASTDHYTVTINSVTSLGGDLKTTWQATFYYGTAPGVSNGYGIAGTGSITSSFAFEWHSNWPKPRFDEFADFFLTPDQCQSMSVDAGGGW